MKKRNLKNLLCLGCCVGSAFIGSVALAESQQMDVHFVIDNQYRASANIPLAMDVYAVANSCLTHHYSNFPMQLWSNYQAFGNCMNNIGKLVIEKMPKGKKYAVGQTGVWEDVDFDKMVYNFWSPAYFMIQGSVVCSRPTGNAQSVDLTLVIDNNGNWVIDPARTTALNCSWRVDPGQMPIMADSKANS